MYEGLDNIQFFDAINLENDLEGLYNIINNKEKKQTHDTNIKLEKLRNNNYKKYTSINLKKYNELPKSFNNVIFEMAKIYKSINAKSIFTQNIKEAIITSKKLFEIYIMVDRLNDMAKTAIKEYDDEVDLKLSKYNFSYFNNLDFSKNDKRKLLHQYNELIMYNSKISKDLLENLKYQMRRKQALDDLEKNISILEQEKLYEKNKTLIKEFNDKLTKVIKTIDNRLTEISNKLNNSKDIEKFNDLLKFYNKLKDYDIKDYENIKQTYEILTDYDKFSIYLDNIENSIHLNSLQEENKEKSAVIKDVYNLLEIIEKYYLNKIDPYQVNLLKEIKIGLNNSNINLENVYNNLKYIINKIWKLEITTLELNDSRTSYMFLCSNSQFLEPKQETILLSDKVVANMSNYLDYQIGFVLNFNDNLRYITLNDNIMDEVENKFSTLITPIQVENIYLKDKKLCRIVLDGKKSKVIGVYYIDTNDRKIKEEAQKLANMYSLPLLALKK